MQNIFIEKVVDFHPVQTGLKYLKPHLGLLTFDKIFDIVDNIETLDVSSEEKTQIEKIKENLHLLKSLKEKIEKINEIYFLSDGFAFFFTPKKGVNEQQFDYYVRNRVWLDESEFNAFNEENAQIISEIREIKRLIKETIPFYSTWENVKNETKSFEVENLNFSTDERIVEFCGTI
jgi:hypothetical protein